MNSKKFDIRTDAHVGEINHIESKYDSSIQDRKKVKPTLKMQILGLLVLFAVSGLGVFLSLYLLDMFSFFGSADDVLKSWLLAAILIVSVSWTHRANYWIWLGLRSRFTLLTESVFISIIVCLLLSVFHTWEELTLILFSLVATWIMLLFATWKLPELMIRIVSTKFLFVVVGNEKLSLSENVLYNSLRSRCALQSVRIVDANKIEELGNITIDFDIPIVAALGDDTAARFIGNADFALLQSDPDERIDNQWNLWSRFDSGSIIFHKNNVFAKQFLFNDAATASCVSGRKEFQAICKRAVDWIVAIFLFVCIAPVFLLIAIAIKSDSPGPIMFRQERIGKNGKPFYMLKFRTMVVDAESLLSSEKGSDWQNFSLFKLKSDPRVTSVGRFLRRYSLDELPQLMNVIGGSMSLVGPRPMLGVESRVTGQSIRVARESVTPGITGMWQVSGRSALTWDESMRADLYYVENWSLSLDFMILLKTFRAAFFDSQQY